MDIRKEQDAYRKARPSRLGRGIDRLTNPFGKALEGMFGGGASGRTAREPQSPYGDNPLGRIFEEMMRGGQASKPAEKPRGNPSGRARTPYDDLFGDMFEAGAKTRDEYQKGMESIFDQFLSGMKKHR